ncbi:MAG: hypothetical protein EXR69_04295, partial [Myxococcales bacterium]|nr:hypothetical protein [Myxococcales bacterium]
MPDTLPSLFLDRVRRSPDAVAMHFWPEGQGKPRPAASGWRTTTWREAEQQVASALDRLRADGVVAGDRVAILGNPHPAWLNADLATLAAGGATVGIYPTLLPEAVHYILRHAAPRLLLVESPSELVRLGAVDGWVAGVPARVWDVPAEPGSAHDSAQDSALAGAAVQRLRAAVAMVTPDQVCTLIYTSGTTGEPKGAVITHAAMTAVCHASRAALPLEGPHRSIVYLPLAHSLQRMAAYRSFLDDIEGWWCTELDDLPVFI